MKSFAREFTDLDDMRLAYAEPEIDISADTCFTEEEQQYMEHNIKEVEGKTQKQKIPTLQKI